MLNLSKIIGEDAILNKDIAIEFDD